MILTIEVTRCENSAKDTRLQTLNACAKYSPTNVINVCNTC